jgi:nucleotide-binding universal stress UspA family protein
VNGSASDRPVLFAYDGSDFAKAAIEVAGRELAAGRAAIVITVWQPLEAIPNGGIAAAGTNEEVDRGVAEQAMEVAEEGVELAKAAGFDATPLTERGTPTWRLIVDAADEKDASLIVLGSHGRTGIKELMLGSVAGAVASHSKRAVLIAH